MILKTLNISCVHRAHNLVTIIIAIIIIVLIYFSLLLFQVNVVRRPDQPLEFFDEAEDRLLLHLRFFISASLWAKQKLSVDHKKSSLKSGYVMQIDVINVFLSLSLNNY